jgi:hypothetical protein
MTPEALRWRDEVYRDAEPWMKPPSLALFESGWTQDWAPQPMSAADLLLFTMRFLSEDYWCAGWMSGLEEACAAEVAGEDVFPRPYYEGVRELLTLLRNEAGGWWQYRTGGEEFVSGPLEVLLPWCGDSGGPRHKALV